MTVLFVFIPSQTGPQPQIWYDAPMTGEEKEKNKPLFKYTLNELEEYDLSIGRLTLNDFVKRFYADVVSNS